MPVAIDVIEVYQWVEVEFTIKIGLHGKIFVIAIFYKLKEGELYIIFLK